MLATKGFEMKTIKPPPRTKIRQRRSDAFFGWKYKLKHFLVGFAFLAAAFFGALWLLSGLNPLNAFSRLTGAFDSQPVFGFAAAEQAFESFTSMTCGDQAYDAAIMTGDTSDNPLANLFTQDMVAGRPSGVVSIAARFDGPGYSMLTDRDSKTVQVLIPGDAYVIYRPAVTDFTDEVHAQGLFPMLSSDEPIIGRVIRDGTVALGQTASTQGGSWYEPCRAEIISAWTGLAGIFGYRAQVIVEPPEFPLEIHYGPLPYDVQSVADVIAQAVEVP